ncbi:FAD/NAD(P)-binding domain-containing protein, partial [Pisolithus marmoratus]
HSLPTLQKLGSIVHSNTNAQAVAESWFVLFAEAMGDAMAVVDLLVDDGFWRDILAFTWDFHTYEGRDTIKQFLADQLPKFNPSAFTLREDLTELHMPYEGIAWIQAFFNFDTTIGHASGIFRLVPLADGSWKAHTIYTSLEGLRGFPEKIDLRNHEMNCGKWDETKEQDFLNEEPTVVIIGGGHSGLILAARLKMLGVNALVVEQNERVGDNWRKRYTSLHLHEPFWCDHLPYFPFPPSWPVFTPGLKFADWLDSYARSLDLNVWTSARAHTVEPNATGKKWTVKVVHEDGREHQLEVDHVVFAIGLFGGSPKVPDILCQDGFNGQLLHSSQYKSAADFRGKKVTVVGSGPSAHGISLDCVDHGVDVTMVQRGPVYVMSAKNGIPKFLGVYVEGGHPIDIADHITLSFPNKFGKFLHQCMIREISELDKDLLEGLRKVGFKLNSGEDDAGALGLVWSRAGGFCIDFGASQKIIDGKIKLKSDGNIARFTPTGLLFEDDSTLDTDVIIFATGYVNARDALLRLLPTHLHNSVQPVWGLDKEGELNSAGRELGGRGPDGEKLSGLWTVMGNVSLSRIYSKFIALQIKAYEEGVFSGRY